MLVLSSNAILSKTHLTSKSNLRKIIFEEMIVLLIALILRICTHNVNSEL